MEKDRQTDANRKAEEQRWKEQRDLNRAHNMALHSADRILPGQQEQQPRDNKRPQNQTSGL